ncbi:MAG TPA: DUF2784 domain-containing protein [Burkholderiaceae bacterium]|nr:DUF2784 domain-containing protein [Burkholderiaceae bacterium]
MINAWVPYRLLADAVLLVHLGIVVFVVGGLLLVVAGNLLHRPWVNGGVFRVAHLLAIAFVVVQAWLGQVCPLTALESWLRTKAGMAGYRSSFIETWVQRILYYDAPTWVFALAYTAFALLVVLAWWRFPPRFRAAARRDAGDGQNLV